MVFKKLCACFTTKSRSSSDNTAPILAKKSTLSSNTSLPEDHSSVPPDLLTQIEANISSIQDYVEFDSVQDSIEFKHIISRAKPKKPKRKLLVDWSSVPFDLLGLVAAKITSLEDYVQFGLACKSWHLVFTAFLSNKSFDQSPWLMLAEKEDEENLSLVSSKRWFYNLKSGRTFQIELPEIKGRWCWGSPFGWLVTYGHVIDMEVRLFNPLSRASIPLPSLSRFFLPHPRCLRAHRSKFYKMVLTASPNFPNCSVFVMFNSYPKFLGGNDLKLGFAKPGDCVWTPIEVPGNLNDIIYFKGNLYACRQDGGVMVLDSSKRTFTSAADPPHSIFQGLSHKYLVDLGGALCLVVRHLSFETLHSTQNCFLTRRFDVYIFDMDTQKWFPHWLLGDWCLFLGSNYSFAVHASEHHLRPSCIYFTDDNYTNYHMSKGSDMGIYHLGKHKLTYFVPFSNPIEKLARPLPITNEMFFEYSVPVWIRPSLH